MSFDFLIGDKPFKRKIGDYDMKRLRPPISEFYNTLAHRKLVQEIGLLTP